MFDSVLGTWFLCCPCWTKFCDLEIINIELMSTVLLTDLKINWRCVFKKGWIQQGATVPEIPTSWTFQKTYFERRPCNRCATAVASWPIHHICIWWPLGAPYQPRGRWYSPKSSALCKMFNSEILKQIFIWGHTLLCATFSWSCYSLRVDCSAFVFTHAFLVISSCSHASISATRGAKSSVVSLSHWFDKLFRTVFFELCYRFKYLKNG